MTVSTSDNLEQYLGNDSATEFDYAFKIFQADDLVVILTASDGTNTTLSRGTDYSVDGVGNEAGGSVTYPLSGDPLATGETLTLLREIPVVQETDLRNQGAYYPETIEDEFDRSRMIDQQQEEAIGRSLKQNRGGTDYDAKGRRVISLGDAVEDGDAINQGQMKAYYAETREILESAQQALANAGYVFVGDYAAGIELTAYNQVVRDTSGEFWRASGSTALPYTTTGAGLPEGGAFVTVGDAALRQGLADKSTPSLGSSLVGHRGEDVRAALDRRSFFVDGISSLQAIDVSNIGSSAQVAVNDDYEGYGGLSYFWDSSRPRTAHNGWSVISPTVPWSTDNAAFVEGVGESSPGSSGCWVLVDSDDGAVDIMVVYGQSNARGSAESADGRLTITPGASYWSRANQSIKKMIYEMESAHDDGFTSSGNAWQAFANRYCEETGRKILMLPGAIGGKSLSELSKGGVIYSDMVDEYNAMSSELSSLGWTVGKTYCLFHQGETDQLDGTTRETYQTQLLQLFDDMELDLSVEHFFIALVGNPQSRPATSWHSVREAQEYVASGRDSVSIAYANCQAFLQFNNLLGSDGVHYTQSGYNLMGWGMASSVAASLKAGDNEISSQLENHRFPEIEGNDYRVKHVNFSLYCSPGDGVQLRNKTDNNTFYSSFIKEVSSVTSTEITIVTDSLRLNRLYGLNIIATDRDGQTEHVDASIKPDFGVDALTFTIRLNKDAVFTIDTSDGSVDMPRLFSATDFSVADDGTDWLVTHNNSPVSPVITRASSTGTSTSASMVYQIVSPTQFKVPKSVGLAVCYFPSFTVRPDGIPAGQGGVEIHVSAIATFARD